MTKSLKSILIIVTIMLCLPEAYQAYGKQTDVGNKLLWVVDGIELKDSLFNCSIEDLRSVDCGVIVATTLKCIHRLTDIESVTILDSLEAVRSGYKDYEGMVVVKTNIKKSIIFIVNGLIHPSDETLSGGELFDQKNIIRVIDCGLYELEKYSIKDFKIIEPKDLPFASAADILPLVVVTTELPFFDYKNLAGDYTGKKGRNRCTLQLNQDSTFVISYTKPRSDSAGRWSIDMDSVVLIPDEGKDAISDKLLIKSLKELVLTSGKKSLKLKRRIERD